MTIIGVILTLGELTERIRRAPVTAAMTFICVALWLWTDRAGEAVYERYALISRAVLDGHEWYRLVTSAFLHFGLQHLFSNMLILFLAGAVAEVNLGSVPFLALYLASALTGNAASVCLDALTGAQTVSVGASGAVFGVMGTILVLLFRARGQIGKGSSLGLRAVLMLLFSVYSGFAAGDVNNAAHLGGLAAGVLLGLLFTRRRSLFDLSGLR